MDETAFNYNPLANTDDGSCVAVVEGCMDQDYLEYDANANTANQDMCITLRSEERRVGTACRYN